MRCPSCDWKFEKDYIEWCWNRFKRLKCIRCGWVDKEKMRGPCIVRKVA